MCVYVCVYVCVIPIYHIISIVFILAGIDAFRVTSVVFRSFYIDVDYLSCGENIARNPLLSQATEEGP